MGLTRRQFMATAASGLAVAGLKSIPARAQEASGTVTIGAYNGIFQDNYVKAVVEPFMQKFPDITVNYYPIANSAQILGTLRAQKESPQIDASIMDVSIAKVGTDEGLYAPLDPARIPSVNDLYDLATTAGVHGRAVTFDHLTLLYNSEAIKTPPTSWQALWDPNLEGRVVVTGIPDIQGIALTIVATKLAGGDPNQGLDAGLEEMAKLAPSVQTWDPKPDVYQLIMSGTADMGIGWNARSQYYADQSAGRLGVVLPQEGSVFQINTINLVANAPNQKAAEVFINYALGPEAQKSFTETMFYAPTNKTAQVSGAALERTAAEHMNEMIPVDWVAIAKVRDRLTEQWRRQVITASR